MRKMLGIFILTALIKGVLLFFIILISSFAGFILMLTGNIFFFVIIGILDWQMLNRIKEEINKYRLIKSLTFSYLSFVATLWISGPLFQLYHYLTNTIVKGKSQMPASALVIFLTLGLITSFVASLTWTRKNKNIVADNV